MTVARALILATAFLLGWARPARAADLVAASGYLISAEINGHPVRLRVDLAASGYVLLNPAVAQRAGLNGSIVRSRALVGPIVLRGGSNAVRINVAGTELRERVAWFD